MALTLNEWHKRFSQQAGWTSALRQYFYKSIKISRQVRILEVGCGTGAVLADFCTGSKEKADSLKIGDSEAFMYGLDIRIEYLSIARKNLEDALLIQGNAYNLPFDSDSFDLTLCHYFLFLEGDSGG